MLPLAWRFVKQDDRLYDKFIWTNNLERELGGSSMAGTVTNVHYNARCTKWGFLFYRMKVVDPPKSRV